MRPLSDSRREAFRRLVLGVLAVGGIMYLLAGAAPAPAEPDGGRGGGPQHFLSGGERSLVILREIKEVLERMDSRLEQMDDKLAQMNRALAASLDRPAQPMENLRGRDH